MLWILAGIALLVIGGELILPFLGEGLILLLETLELTVDTLFEELLHFAPQSAQLATAWLGLIVLVLLLVWGSIRLKGLYDHAKEAAPACREAKLKAVQSWWTSLVWYHQILIVAYGVGLMLLILLFL